MNISTETPVAATERQRKARNWPLIVALTIAIILATTRFFMGYPLIGLAIQFIFNLILYWLIGFVVRFFWRLFLRVGDKVLPPNEN